MATSIKLVVRNKIGIHMRPAVVFGRAAEKFKSEITIKAFGKECDAKSLMDLMCMGLIKGTEFELVADGEDEAEAIATLKDVVEKELVKYDN